jgi:hypothetical protein
MYRSLKLATTVAILLTGSSMALAQTPKAKAGTKVAAGGMSAARLGGHPNLNGIWQVMNTANFNLEPHDAAAAKSLATQTEIGALGATHAGLGVVDGGTIPYKPDALKIRDDNRSKAPKADPEAACYLPGIPRATYIDMPFQIIQADDGDILMAYEYDAANRVVRMKKVEVPPIDTWMGTSFGAWEGDTLKVVTLSQNPGEVMNPGAPGTTPGVTWLDRSGNFLTGTATVTERFIPIDHDHMNYEVTIEDPAIFTKPWKISMPIYRRMEKNAQLLDYRCVPFADMLVYGDLYADKDKYPKK